MSKRRQKSAEKVTGDQDWGARVHRLAADMGGVAALAKLVGVSPTMVRKWQSGADTSRSTLVELARVTDVRLEWLATGRGEMRGGPHLSEGYPRALEVIETRTVMASLCSQIELAFAAFADGDAAAKQVVEVAERAESDAVFKTLPSDDQARLSALVERGYAKGLLAAVLVEKSNGREPHLRAAVVQRVLAEETRSIVSVLRPPPQ